MSIPLVQFARWSGYIQSRGVPALEKFGINKKGPLKAQSKVDSFDKKLRANHFLLYDNVNTSHAICYANSANVNTSHAICSVIGSNPVPRGSPAETARYFWTVTIKKPSKANTSDKTLRVKHLLVDDMSTLLMQFARSFSGISTPLMQFRM